MKQRIRAFLNALDEYNRTNPESVGVELQLDLAQIVLAGVKRLGWTQDRLAKEADVSQGQINRILHGERNCTFDTAGRILFALGIRAKLKEVPEGKARTKTKTRT